MCEYCSTFEGILAWFLNCSLTLLVFGYAVLSWKKVFSKRKENKSDTPDK